MQIGQCLGIREPGGFLDEAFDQRQDAVGAIDETFDDLTRVNGLLTGAPFVQPSLGARGVFSGRQEHETEIVRALEMAARLFELGSAFGVDQRRNGVGKRAVRIILRLVAARLDKDRPAGAEPAQGIIEPARGADEFGRRRRIEVRTAETRGALERTVLVEDDAGRDQRRPR